MNLRYRPLISVLFCFWTLAGCKYRVRYTHSAADAPVSQAHKDDPVITDLDTSMVSLKAGAKVSMTDLMSQVWEFDDADPAHWNAIFWDSAENARIYPELALFKDLTVTANARCHIQMGKWELNKELRELRLRFDDGASTIYHIHQAAVEHMEMIRIQGDDNALIQLSAQAIAHRRPEEDPFYPLNNWWRKRPTVPETAEQIRGRVQNYLHFFALFFLDNHLRQQTEISFIGLPCCFIWYNGGIGIQGESDLDERWARCFYSKAQALKGHALLVSLLKSHTLNWPEHPTSWISQTGDVLQQMADKL